MAINSFNEAKSIKITDLIVTNHMIKEMKKSSLKKNKLKNVKKLIRFNRLKIDGNDYALLFIELGED